MTQNPQKSNWRWWAVALLSITLLIVLFIARRNAPEKLALTDIAAQIRAGDPAIDTMIVTNQQVDVDYIPDRKSAVTHIGSSSSLVEQLYDLSVSPEQLNGIKIEYKASNQWTANLAINLLPILLLVIFFIWMVRRANQMPSSVTDFGRTRARQSENVTERFADVIGVEDAKQALWNLVLFLREPERFIRFGARVPRGILLVGPSGTGKTLLAKALAGETDIKFLSVAGSEFVEMFVGVGAARVRDLFKTARENQPCIIFIDEIDAIGKRRGGGISMGSNDEREQTLNQLLVEMDGFETTDNVLVLAATNRVDVLDSALLRPGRFDRNIYVPLPTYQDRVEMFKLFTRGKPLGSDVQLELLAQKMPGKSGADIATIVNQAAFLAASKNVRSISMTIIEEAARQIGVALPEIGETRVIEAKLSEVVSGQDDAKATLAKAALLHYQFAVKDFGFTHYPINRQKSNAASVKPTVLLVGPSGTGKTLLVSTLADRLNVPFVSIEVEKLDYYQFGNTALHKSLLKLLRAANGDMNKAQYGIITVEGMEKLVGDENGKISMWSKQLQQNLLDLIRGEDINVSLTDNAYDSNPVLFNTSNILFICEGNFGQFSEKIAADPRMLSGMGFISELVSCFSLYTNTNPLTHAQFVQMLDPDWAGSAIQKYQRLLAIQDISMEMPQESREQLAEAALRLGLDGRFINLMLYDLWHRIVEGKRHHVIVDEYMIKNILFHWDSASINREPPKNSISLAELDHKSPQEIRDILL